ncbi:MAG: glutamyl-tRNA amidotransferase [Pusillimonas sp.]|nr:glutamyl-tRNA amidotransferase [Pusillimonas sp.]MBC43546.1 glutamyl-tRNA amidotransferase [Pusillimonas sp.]HCP76606.1 glutamyl-tRNA amidotransferase [Pusillimonas sp.]|tara:strand:- start:99 stop:560 length:462 start_codon:yes stop_codon:yes gene_type:complete
MSSSLKQDLTDSIKSAMKAKQSARLGTLRFLQAAVKQKEVDERRELNDTEILAIIEKQVKQRRESIAAFEKAGRTETVAQEQAELAILQEFLPQQAPQEEVDAVIDKAIAQVTSQGIEGPAAMGKVMGMVKTELAGRADMSAVSAQVKQKLAP